MSDVQTIPAKYVYLDVVGFTKNRSVDAQADIVHALNKIVSESLSELKIEKENLILLPTGDGMCIALLNVEILFEIHLQLALDILKRLHECNIRTRNKMRKFQVRIGINANVDNLVIDINGNRNLAGEGINMAARIMSLAEENQIFVGSSVFDTLKGREKYMNSFRYHSEKVKHGLTIVAYRYIAKKQIGLNISIPDKTANTSESLKKLSQFMAYYFAHAIENRDLFLRNVMSVSDFAGKTLLWFLAQESLEFANATDVEKVRLRANRKKFDTTEARYEHYDSQDWGLISEVAKVIDCKISPFSEYFEGYDSFIYVTPKGVQKLKDEFPAIWEEFDLKSF